MRRGRLVGILLRAQALLHAVRAASAPRRAPWAPMRSTSSSPVGSNKVPRRSGITAGRSVPAARTPPGRGTRRQLILHPSARAQPEVVDLGICGALSSPPRRDLSPLLPTPASTTGGVASYGNSDRSSARGRRKEKKRYALEILAAYFPSDVCQAIQGGRYFVYRPPRKVAGRRAASRHRPPGRHHRRSRAILASASSSPSPRSRALAGLLADARTPPARPVAPVGAVAKAARLPEAQPIDSEMTRRPRESLVASDLGGVHRRWESL